MRAVATPWYKLYKPILFGFGIPFTLIGLIILYLAGNLAFLINGVLWIVIGLGLKIKGDYNQRKFEILKKEGLYHDGSVVHIFPAHGVRIGSYITARVECTYKAENGDSFVKSGYYLLSPLDKIENLHAKIYIDFNNLEKYFVELYRVDTGVVL